MEVSALLDRLQLQADLLGRPVLPSLEPETTAAGAAGLAAVGLDLVDLDGLAARDGLAPP